MDLKQGDFVKILIYTKDTLKQLTGFLILKRLRVV
jgi:hypothetical protein